MKKVLLVALLIIGVCGVKLPAYGQAVVVADFDSGKKPNNIGGDFGAWSKDPKDKTQSARESFDKKNSRVEGGYCMKVTYDVDSPNAAFNGFWMKLNDMDASAKKKVVFWAKADTEKDCTSTFKVELKNASESGAYYVEGLTKEWKKFEISLDEFGLTDLATLKEMVIVFEDHTSNPKEGVLYLDDVSFE